MFLGGVKICHNYPDQSSARRILDFGGSSFMPTEDGKTFGMWA
jgi:hypothetical protein